MASAIVGISGRVNLHEGMEAINLIHAAVFVWKIGACLAENVFSSKTSQLMLGGQNKKCLFKILRNT